MPESRDEQPALTDLDAARARFIRELRGDFGVNDEGIDIVLHLVDQLHGMRQALGELRAELQLTTHSATEGTSGKPAAR